MRSFAAKCTEQEEKHVLCTQGGRDGTGKETRVDIRTLQFRAVKTRLIYLRIEYINLHAFIK